MRFVLAVVLLAMPTALLAHGALKASSPARNARLTSLPNALQLTFTERVELSVARVVLVRGLRDTVSLAPLAIDSTGRMLVANVSKAGVTGRPDTGAYVIHWLITGQDGHPVRGTIPFMVVADSIGAAQLPGDTARVIAAGDTIPVGRDTSGVGDGRQTDTGSYDGTVAGGVFASSGALHTFARWVGFSALFALLGTIASLITIVPSLERQGRSGFAQAVKARAISVGLVAAVLLGLVEAGRLVLQYRALTVDNSTLSYASLLGSTTWGTAWLVRFQAVIGAILAMLLARRVTRGWYRASVAIAALAAVGIAAGVSLGGHAAGVVPMMQAVAIDMGHVLSAGTWIGTLGLLLLVVFPLLRSDAATALIAVRTFSRIAIAAVTVMLVTGVFTAVSHLGSWNALTESTYGQVLLVKLGVVLVVLALGARNQWRIRNDRTSAGERIASVRRSGRVELITAIAVLLVTSVLVAMPTPPTAMH